MDTQLRAEDIAKTYVDADDPLEFIQKNLALKVNKTTVEPEPAPIQEAPKEVTAFPEDPYALLEESNTEVPKTEVGAEAEATTKEETSAEDQEEESPIEKKKNDKETNLRRVNKKLEAILEEKNQVLAEKEQVAQERDQLKQELENIKVGFAPQSKVDELVEEINTLKYYRDIVDFENSPEFKNTYQSRVDSAVANARRIAEEYGVDPRHLDKAAQIPNKLERNKYLKGIFGDEVAAHEARLAVEEYEQASIAAIEARKKPAEERERLRAEYAERQKKETAERLDKLVRETKSSWVESLKEMEDLDRYPDLNLKPNDPEHNKYVAPAVAEAAKEYAKFIKLLAELGVKELPKEAQKVLAKTFQTSRAYTLANESRNQYRAQLEEILNEQNKKRAYTRPGVGVSMPGNSSTQAQANDAPVPLKSKLDSFVKKFA